MLRESWMVGQWVANLSDPGFPCSCFFSKEAERTQKNFVTCLGLKIWPVWCQSKFFAELCRSYAEGFRWLGAVHGSLQLAFLLCVCGKRRRCTVKASSHSKAQLPAPIHRTELQTIAGPHPRFLGQSPGSPTQLLICGSLWSQGPTSEEKNHCGQWHRAKHSSVHLKMNNV